MKRGVFILTILFPVILVASEKLPSLDGTSKDPIFAIADEDVFIDCTVRDITNYTLVWRYMSQSESTRLSSNGDSTAGSNSKIVTSTTWLDKSPFTSSPSSISKGEVLTAGNIRVTSDNRFSVLHETGANTWILQITRARESDSGIYTCELNTQPIESISRVLVVAPEVDDSSNIKSILEVEHNYTSCCAAEKIPKICYHFCNFKGLIGPDTSSAVSNGAIQTCINYLPSITKCLADGRDHMPCCMRQNIPDPCRPVCVGNFTLSTVLDHFTCMSYTAPVLACIAEGVQILPPQPRGVTVNPLSSTSLRVEWISPFNKLSSYNAPIDTYQINITQLHSFDAIGTAKIAPSASASSSLPSEPSLYGLQMRYTVSSNDTSFIITDLKPYTMYEITMRSANKAGYSLSINSIRTLTLSPDSDTRETTSSGTVDKSKPESGSGDDVTVSTDKINHPEREIEDDNADKVNTGGKKNKILPDTKACCRSNGVNIDRCVNTLCDPVKSDETTLADLMICAPWANVTFKCMANNIDHSSCCKQRGVTSNCLSFCSGNVTRLDFRQFVCLEHINTFATCLLDHYGVLPSVPRNFMVVNVHHDWAILKWSSEDAKRDANVKYLIHWRDVSKNDEILPYNVTSATQSPYLLDRLTPGGRYEVYVKTVNQYGTSEGSSRVVFSTPPLTINTGIDNLSSNSFATYNETQCCARASLTPDCMPLCSYKVKVTDVINKAATCSSNLPILVRCGAGGRNHIPCCRRRSVTDSCLNLCAGLVESSPFVVAARCADDMGKILQCMQDGSGLIPGMPIDFHATLVTKTSIHLAWDPSIEDTNSTSNLYQVRYGKSDEDIPLHPLEHDKSVNTTSTNIIINNLLPSTRYSFYVVSSNSYGISLPSLVLVVNTSDTDDVDGKRSLVKSNIGPPHSIQLLHQSVDSITIKWLPPLYLSPDIRLRYIINYKPINGTAAGTKTLDELENAPWETLQTTYNTMFITNLTYDSEYAIAIQAVNEKDSSIKSTLSEIVLVWTDPAIPASVNLPVIIPAGPIYEGGNVTFMCIGIGTPPPVLSMFLNGHEVMREERRHITLTVIAVQRNLTSISCFASNGFGSGAQSTLELRVRFKPSVTVVGNGNQVALSQAPGRLQCQFTGNPMPHVIWSKDAGGKQVSISQNNRVSFVTVAHSENPFTWINSLVITSVEPNDGGKYHCSAVNDIGQETADLKLDVDLSRNYTNNATGCCASMGVSLECRKVCSFDVDIESALQIPQCYSELDKLMMCAADGSDHRQCCRRKGVPVDCMRWCAGLKVTRPAICSLSSSQDIISCFQEGKALLPGPPSDLHVTRKMEENKIIIDWTPPKKNAELVQYYRVFWRPVGSRDLNRNETDKPHFELDNLDTNKMYEFVVKSGNHYGLSIFTDPLVISMNGSVTSSMATNVIRIITGLSITVAIVLAITGAAYYALRNHLPVTIQSIRLRSSISNLTNIGSSNDNGNNNNNNTSRGVSFENPSYMKDSGPVVQFSAPSNVEVNANFPS